MSCAKPNSSKCIEDGIPVVLFVPTTTSTTTTAGPCYIVDCDGDFLVDCECDYISCIDCASLCIIGDCENNTLVDCLGDIIICNECQPTSSTTTSTTTTILITTSTTTTIFIPTTSTTTTNNPLEEIVYTYNKSSWSDTNDFYISNGLDKSVSLGKLIFNTQGLTTQYAEMGQSIQRWHCYERTYDVIQWKLLSTPNSTNTGWKMRYGNSFTADVGFNPFTGKIEARGSNNTLFTSAGTLTASLNDVLKITIERVQLTLNITVQNLTTVQSISMNTFSYGIANVGTDNIVPDTGGRSIRFASLSNNENVEFQQISLGLKKYQNVKVLCAGDSITAGYTCGTAANRWSQKLNANFNTEIAGGPGDATAQCYVSCITLVPLIQPEYVLVGIGVNDGSGIPQPTYTNLVNQIIADGSTPILFLMANDVRNQVPDWTWIQSTFPSYVMVNPWNATLKVGSLTGEVNPAYKIDTNHYNALGNDAIYNAILASGKIV